MKRLYIGIILLTALTVSFGTAFAAEVVQGKCVTFSPEAQKLVVEEYDINFSKESPYGHPTGILFEGDLKTAKVGIQPVPGDILRISYKVDGNSKQVLKVMNVSKQDLRKK